MIDCHWFVGLALYVTFGVETVCKGLCAWFILTLFLHTNKHLQGFTGKHYHSFKRWCHATGFFLEQNWFYAITSQAFHLLFQHFLKASVQKNTRCQWWWAHRLCSLAAWKCGCNLSEGGAIVLHRIRQWGWKCVRGLVWQEYFKQSQTKLHPLKNTETQQLFIWMHWNNRDLGHMSKTSQQKINNCGSNSKLKIKWRYSGGQRGQ